jgi:hypothetical protein
MDALRGRARAATREPATRAPAVIAELGGFTRPRLVFSRQKKKRLVERRLIDEYRN